MNTESTDLKDILLKGNFITKEVADKADAYIKEHGTSFRQYLIDSKIINDDVIGKATAVSLGIPYSDLNSLMISKEQVLIIPEELAKKYRIVIFSWINNDIMVTTDTHQSTESLAEITRLFPGSKITITYSLPRDIDAALLYYQQSLGEKFSKIIEKKERVTPEIMDQIFEDALVSRASDIHLEPQKDDIVIRFRVDGVLHEAARIPKTYHENILNRIKVKSGLRIDEHFSAQDGSLRYEKNGRIVDMRASITPTIEGEKIVLRVLSSYLQSLELTDIGLSPKFQELIRDMIQKPFGMILVVGPTGSGKTTTLYALLQLLNNPERNITTIEDPVEYRIKNINQIQVNPQTNLTFAQGLRSIVRQDPDTILVGEIRDKETAEIAVNAALTGHLLMSTFHANDAGTAIPRLLDMGIEPFLLSSTLEVIIAQRLVRKICENCRMSIPKIPEDFDTPKLKSVLPYLPGSSLTLYKGDGCQVCNNTGYKGRTAIFEFIRITPAMQNLITQKQSSVSIWKQARLEGSLSFFEDGIEKVKNGVTTIEELLRVAEPPKL